MKLVTAVLASTIILAPAAMIAQTTHSWRTRL